ncbi:hypothetical protein GCM10023185_09120 [Hymenobacter saemangeumensis]|uniref:Glycosyltransferase RgtA/B/C/D-like domain-containing protein n=1 Tax=Hymenobacter saemangeumensis TaxID=1084522 RepID=A0ABP8I3Z8_9BACT
MKPRVTHPYSLAAIVALFLLLIQVRLWAPYFNTHNVQAVLTWDAMGYYLYLPAHFIYHDLSRLSFIPEILREYNPTGSFFQAFPAPDGPAGAMIMKYPIGLAILNTPFFWLGHWAARHWNYAQDGFSAPYQVAIAFGSIVYSLLGLGLLRRVLLRYVSDVVAALTLTLIVLGTNYLQYSAIDGAMAHNVGFTLYALLLWLTVRWHEQPRRWLAAAIGLTLGLLVIVRPSDMVAVLIPLLWGITSAAAAREKLHLLLHRHRAHLLLLLGCGVLAVLPQLLYWKWASGHFIVYSYEEQGFSFLKPHTRQVLFSFRKGWLLYTPLMVLPLVGLVVLWRRNRAVAVPVLAYFLVNLWVVSAWDVWWYGGSLSQRALVQSYATLALPLAFLLAALGQARPVLRGAVLLLAALLVNLNLVMHWQYMNGIIDSENMNRRYYWAVFGNVHPTQDELNLFDTKNRLPGTIDRYNRRQVALLTLDDQPISAETGITGDLGYHSAHSYRSENGRTYSPTIALPLREAGLAPGQWVRGSVLVHADEGAWGQKLVVSLERGGKTIMWENTRLQNRLSVSQRWTPVWLDVPLPADARPEDVVKVFVLNENGGPCYLDNIQLEALEPKSGW